MMTSPEMSKAGRSSSAVVRAAAILDFIAEHADEEFTMAELVRYLKISQSTCHSLLNSLVDVGYLYKTPEKTYVLGANLVAIAGKAVDRTSLVKMAKPELRKLANRFDLVCSALVIEGNESIVRERATSARHVGLSRHIGMSLRARAPMVAAYYLSTPRKASAWLRAAELDDIEAEERELKAGLEFVHLHGYLVLLENPDAPPLTRSRDSRFDEPVDRLPVRALYSIDADAGYSLSSILVPVFNGDGEVEFLLSLIGYDNPVTGADIQRYAKELMDASDRISRFVMAPPDRDLLRQV